MFSGSKPKFLKPIDDLAVKTTEGDQHTSFIYNAHHAQSISQQREQLPIFKYIKHILYCVENYQVLIIVGETGSGKSTQIPQYLYDLAGWHTNGKIGIVEPRRISAITLADRVASERGEIVGETVGVAVRFLDNTSEKTKIKYMTEGIFVREILADPLLNDYSVIIVDEAHERNILTDTILALLKKLLIKRKKLKIIVASATIDADFFKEYFNVKKEGNPDENSSIILSVEGRMHPVDTFFIREPCPDYVKETVETIFKIHEKEPPGDILAFLTGQDEVEDALEMVRDRISNDKMNALPLYGTLSNQEQLKVFFTAPKGVRKVIIATNIAETSITIPGIVYVIDCGFTKQKFFNTATCTEGLYVVPISKATATQRAGRAGRVRPGKSYKLYTEEDYNSLKDNNIPEMQRSDVSSAILYCKVLGVNNLLTFEFPSPPRIKSLYSAIKSLHALKGLDDKGKLTLPLGYFLAEIPLSPMFAKMLYVSGEMGCSEEILSIISMLEVKSVFSQPFTGQGKINARTAKRNFEVAEGDLITSLNVYTSFIQNDMSKDFCRQHYLIYRHLMDAHNLREKLSRIANKRFDIPLVSSNGDIEKICKCITAGLFMNSAYLHHSGVYKKIVGDNELHIHPMSVLLSEQPAKYVIYAELLETTKLYINNVTVVKEEWLTEMAPDFYVKGTVR